MTFRRILIGLEQSFQDDQVFRRALEQAKPHYSSLLIVHSLKAEGNPPNLPGSYQHSYSAGYQASDAIGLQDTLRKVQQRRVEHERHRAHEMLNLYVEHANAKGIPCQVDCRVVQPEVRICQLAQEWEADLIVLGHRSQGGIRQVGFESVTQYVLQRVGCSVMVVNGIEPRISIHESETVLESMNSDYLPTFDLPRSPDLPCPPERLPVRELQPQPAHTQNRITRIQADDDENSLAAGLTYHQARQQSHPVAIAQRTSGTDRSPSNSDPRLDPRALALQMMNSSKTVMSRTDKGKRF